MALVVNIIGAGNLGKTIGHLLVKHQLVKIGAICNRSEKSSLNAIKFIGQGKYCPLIEELAPADITFITTPDDLISGICEKLSENRFIKKASIVLHCSGSISSEALLSMKAKGCYIASVHPMISFATPELSVEQYKGTFCAVEGDEEALPQLRDLFNSIGSMTYDIAKVKKSSYHAAGVFASNYVVTLAQQALSCMRAAGVEDERAMRVITNIMQSTVSNLEKTLSPEQSLTGPIKRGDVTTLTKHLDSLADLEQKELYATLGKATMNLTDHNSQKKDLMSRALSFRGKK